MQSAARSRRLHPLAPRRRLDSRDSPKNLDAYEGTEYLLPAQFKISNLQASFTTEVFLLDSLSGEEREFARRDSAEDFLSIESAVLHTAMDWILIPAYCFAIP